MIPADVLDDADDELVDDDTETEIPGDVIDAADIPEEEM